ncbi:MAG TPA: hypothetical protein VIY49_34705 [Bryobacteraceae bacterium]
MKKTPLGFLVAVAGSVVSIGCQGTGYAPLYPAILYPAIPPPPAPASLPGVIEPRSPSFAYGATKLMIFGGPNRRVYLGCLNCSQISTDSVLNPAGEHGSPVFQESVYNHAGPYGSLVSPESACNPVANDPPMILDQSGRYYGRLTLNRLTPQIGIGLQFFAWLNRVCGS